MAHILARLYPSFSGRWLPKCRKSSVTSKKICVLLRAMMWYVLLKGWLHVAHLDGFIFPRALDTQALLWDAEGHLCSRAPCRRLYDLTRLVPPKFTSHLPDLTQLMAFSHVFTCLYPTGSDSMFFWSFWSFEDLAMLGFVGSLRILRALWLRTSNWCKMTQTRSATLFDTRHGAHSIFVIAACLGSFGIAKGCGFLADEKEGMEGMEGTCKDLIHQDQAIIRMYPCDITFQVTCHTKIAVR